MSRKIIHLDMDCFYAAVEVRYRPDLKGKPVAVGGSPEGRGVLTTASYEARRFGVRSAMPTARALKLCPDLILIRPDFSKYRNESLKVRQIMRRYTEKIQPLSLDEAYLDVTGSPLESGSATRIAQSLRQAIKDELGLTASAGVAPNKFLAKIASDLNKPDGLTVIRPDQVDAFVHGLAVEKIWGVGKVTAERMHKLGYKTCGDLQRLSQAEMIETFGSWGVQLYGFARGIDHREVHDRSPRKSLSVEETFRSDRVQRREVQAAAAELYADFRERMDRYQTSELRSAYVKIKFSDFRAKGRECQWKSIEDGRNIPPLEIFRELIDRALDGETKPVRLLGLGVKFRTDDDEDRVGSATGADGLQLRLVE